MRYSLIESAITNNYLLFNSICYNLWKLHKFLWCKSFDLHSFHSRVKWNDKTRTPVKQSNFYKYSLNPCSTCDIWLDNRIGCVLFQFKRKFSSILLQLSASINNEYYYICTYGNLNSSLLIKHNNKFWGAPMI